MAGAPVAGRRVAVSVVVPVRLVTPRLRAHDLVAAGRTFSEVAPTRESTLSAPARTFTSAAAARTVVIVAPATEEPT